MKDFKEICQRAVDLYGRASQVDKCIEEMSELGAALMQFRHGRLGAADVITEIADVAIMAYNSASTTTEHFARRDSPERNAKL